MTSSPITDLEYGILVKLSGARFPPATASKRFVRDWFNGYIKQLSPRGRRFLAFIAHRYRRQYRLSDSEQAWVDQWIRWEPPGLKSCRALQ